MNQLTKQIIIIQTMKISGELNLSTMPYSNIASTAQYHDISNVSCTTNTMSNITSSLPAHGLPDEMKFSERNIITIFLYGIFFVVAASGNLTVFITLFRNRGTKARVNLYIMHLAIADLIVTFFMMPMEIGWHATVDWRGSGALCRILMFFRVFGLYLSSFVLVVISLDRYFAILHPLSLNDAKRRGNNMLVVSWVCSAIASSPQVLHLYHRLDFKSYINRNCMLQSTT